MNLKNVEYMNNQILSPRYASFKIRALAYLIDLGLLSLSTCLLIAINDALPHPNLTIFKELAGLIISTLYHTILTASSRHGTIGKQIMKII